MSAFSVIRMNALVLAVISITMVIPLTVACILGETGMILPFAVTMGVGILVGLIFLLVGRNSKFSLSSRSSFVAVALCWVTASLIGAVPLYFSGAFPSVPDAIFESVSGFTTTGSTVLGELESLPRSLNLWRCQMHWLGGMGIVALTVALLPLFGVGGFQLIKAETTGPEKGKITPTITMTAKILWFIYFGFTVLQTLLLMLAGLDFIDALMHTFSTLGTGGFSCKNASVGGYNSVAVDWICIVFMALSGVNFSLYYYLFMRRAKEVASNSEFKAYIWILVISILGITFNILPKYGNFFQSLRYAAFQAVSIISTTGFANANYCDWPAFSQMIIFALMLIGACSGSTAGGVKIIRWLILGKQMNVEMNRMIHPHGVFTIRINGRAARSDLVNSVGSFLFAYFALVGITAIVASFNNVDPFTALTTGMTLVGNIGPGFNMISPVDNFSFFGGLSKLWFCFAMIAGRLELYTMIIYFSPAFWKGKR